MVMTKLGLLYILDFVTRTRVMATLTRPLIFTDKSDKEVTEDPFPIGRRL